MKNEKFVDLYKKTLIDPPIYHGALIKGIITNIDNNFVTINGFLKSDCYIPISQFKDEKGELEVKIGDTIELVIDIVEDLSGEIKLSREKARRIRAWETLENIYNSDKVTTGHVIAKVKGGFTVKIDVLKAFLPGSLVSFRSVLEGDDIKGKELKFKIIKLEKKKNNIVVSQKFMLEEESGENIQNIINKLQEGNILTGIIKNITDYGVFIDLGGIDGLLHITDMSWKRIKHPSDLVKIGSEIKVKVLKFDKTTNRVSLGLKQLTKDPWNDIRKKYKENMTVIGVVTNITDYGCFVELEEGIEGLVHLSEMDWTNKNANPRKIVKHGMRLRVTILDINTIKRRISLGLKQNNKNPWFLFSERYKLGEKIKGRIKTITDFGVFIELNYNLDGLLHIMDISWGKFDTNYLLRKFSKGKFIKLIILTIDPERERIGLGLKQLTVDPFAIYLKKNKRKKITNAKIYQKKNLDTAVKLSNNVYGLLKNKNKMINYKIYKPKPHTKIKVKILKYDKKNKIILTEHVEKQIYNKATYYLNNKHTINPKKLKKIFKNF